MIQSTKVPTVSSRSGMAERHASFTEPPTGVVRSFRVRFHPVRFFSYFDVKDNYSSA